MLFAICADRGAPGSTTTALALAAARGLPAVVVEADPYGGDLALRLRREGNPLPSTPTVLSVAAGRSARRSPQGLEQGPEQGPAPRTTSAAISERGRRDVWSGGSHTLSEHVRVIPGLVTAEHGTSLAWPALANALEEQTVPVFADLGRIHTGSPSLSVAAAADALIPVCRNDMASVQHMIDRLELLVPAIAERRGRPPIVLPVVVAPRQHGSTIANSIAEILAETAVGPTLRGVSWLAWDPTGVSQLESGADPWGKPLRKSPLMRTARKVLWMVGLATGLPHADPSTEASGQSRWRRRSRGHGSADEPRSWASPHIQPVEPDGYPHSAAQPQTPAATQPSFRPPARDVAPATSRGLATASTAWDPRRGNSDTPQNGIGSDNPAVEKSDGTGDEQAHGEGMDKPSAEVKVEANAPVNAPAARDVQGGDHGEADGGVRGGVHGGVSGPRADLEARLGHWESAARQGMR